MTTQVIVSAHNEDISWVNYLKCPYIIYNKSDTKIINTIHRPNIGREAETFLYHIINNYGNLPDVLITLQGDPRSNPIQYTFDQCINIINCNLYDANNLNILCSNVGKTLAQTYWHKQVKSIQDLFFDIDEKFYITYSMGAQYAIPKHIILNRPIELYNIFYALITKYKFNTICNNTNILMGIDAWAMEIVWGMLFDIDIKITLTDNELKQLEKKLK